MRDVLKRLGMRPVAPGAVIGALLALGLVAGAALAAENEVRLPVEKTARITPVGEVVDPDAAKNAKAAKAVPQPAEKGPALKAPKTALAKAAEAAAANPAPTASPAPAEAKPQAAKPAPAKKPAKPAAEAPAEAAKAAAKPEPKPEAQAAAKPEPKPKAEKPAAPPPRATKTDPLAAVLPPAQPAPPAATPLPADGQWVGDLRLEFHADRVVLHAATNGPVERVTWFNLAGRDGPRKLAADLRGGWRKKGGSVLRFDTGPVKVVVVGEHPDRLRLAVEFRDGAVKPDLEPKVETGKDGVTLTLPLAVRLAQ